jgi:hypothetical protein
MKISRLLIIFSISGAVFKATLILLWRLYQPDEIITLLFNDPIGFWIAEKVTQIIFDQRRYEPSLNEAVGFEIVVVIAFAVQCFLLGLLLQAVFHKVYKKHRLDDDKKRIE